VGYYKNSISYIIYEIENNLNKRGVVALVVTVEPIRGEVPHPLLIFIFQYIILDIGA
jgi:hypothetical protein